MLRNMVRYFQCPLLFSSSPTYPNTIRHATGPVTRLSLFGMHIISLNTPDAMHALLNQAAFSDRPQVVFGGEMCGWANTLALQRYGEDFKAFRRELHQVLGTHAAIAKFHPLIEVEMRRFLLRVFHDSSRLLEHVQV